MVSFKTVGVTLASLLLSLTFYATPTEAKHKYKKLVYDLTPYEHDDCSERFYGWPEGAIWTQKLTIDMGKRPGPERAHISECRNWNHASGLKKGINSYDVKHSSNHGEWMKLSDKKRQHELYYCELEWFAGSKCEGEAISLLRDMTDPFVEQPRCHGNFTTVDENGQSLARSARMVCWKREDAGRMQGGVEYTYGRPPNEDGAPDHGYRSLLPIFQPVPPLQVSTTFARPTTTDDIEELRTRISLPPRTSTRIVATVSV